MRGTLTTDKFLIDIPGIIPAYAGNTYIHRRQPTSLQDHPRVCGEHRNPASVVAVGTGSSPRMRGTQLGLVRVAPVAGIIPAYAGNTRWSPACRPAWRDHPRVCGEHDCLEHLLHADGGSSPRMRGTLGAAEIDELLAGIIPAYAGNTLRDYSNFVVSKFMSFVFHLV